MIGNQKTILLVEDEALIAMKEKMDLEKEGYIVHYVGNGEKAVHAILENTLPVDLILMDINLGAGIDGTQAAEQILSQKDIPVVFLSSHTERHIVEKTEKITSYGYVVKNSGIVVLDASIKMALKLFEEKTEKKKAMDQFNRERERLDYIMGVTGTGYDIIDGDFNILFIDNNWRTVYGDPTNRKCYEYFNGYSEPCPGCGIPTALATKEVVVTEEILTKEDNRIVQVHSIPFEDSSGQWLVAEFNIDITHHKAFEEELRRGRDLLDITQRIGRIGGWEWDIDRQIMTWTDETYRIHGMIPGVPPTGSPELIARSLACYDCADKPVVESAFRHCETEGVAYDIEFPMTRCDGTRMWIRTMAEAIKEGDRVVKVVGNIIDITDRKQAEEKIQKQLAEKEILLREIHHRVKNNIANIESFLTLQAGSTNSPEVQTALQDTISRVQSIRVLYDNLLLSKDFHDVSIKSYTESLIGSLVSVYNPTGNIIIEKQIADFSINAKIAVAIGIIINELLTNVFKYAFLDRDSGSVSLSIEKTENRVILTVRDNGIGIEERIKSNKSPGFGLIIVKMLTEQLNGTYSMLIENGTTSIVQFDA